MNLLNGKFVAITGAASLNGIGRRTAEIFAEQGATVAILDLDENSAKTAAEKLVGQGHIGLGLDVTDLDSCMQVVQKILNVFPRIDVLVNNAGITQPVKFLDISSQDYVRITDVSLKGTLNMSQAIVPQMKKQKAGSIICMSSVSAQRGGGIFGGPHYSAAKAGVLGLAKAMARELGTDNIRVNSIAPGLIQTDITQGKLSDEMKLDILKGIPLNRLGRTDDVAYACLYLGSDMSTYLTGTTINVNGGMHIE